MERIVSVALYLARVVICPFKFSITTFWAFIKSPKRFITHFLSSIKILRPGVQGAEAKDQMAGFRVDSREEDHDDGDDWILRPGGKRAEAGIRVDSREEDHDDGDDWAFGRSQYAKRDMQNYISDYQDVIAKLPMIKNNHTDFNLLENDMQNLRFYQNKRKSSPDDLFLHDFHTQWKGRYNKLENVHSYIQWLFPILEPGMNYYAHTLTYKEIKAFRNDETLKKKLVTSYELMLDFYGIELVNEETGEVARSGNWKERFKNLNRNTHNNLRITRILKCLGLLGLEHYQAPLVRFFLKEALVNGELCNVKRSVLDYFMFAVIDKRERGELIKYAYSKYRVQDKLERRPIWSRTTDEESSVNGSPGEPSEQEMPQTENREPAKGSENMHSTDQCSEQATENDSESNNPNATVSDKQLPVTTADDSTKYLLISIPSPKDTTEDLEMQQTTNEDPESKAKADPESKAKADPESKAKADPESKAKADPESKAKADPESKAKADPESKAKADPGSKAKADPGSKDKADPESKAKADPESKAKADPGSKDKADPESKDKADPESKAKADPESKAKADPESKAKADPESKDKADPESKDKADPESKANTRGSDEQETANEVSTSQKEADARAESNTDGREGTEGITMHVNENLDPEGEEETGVELSTKF